MYRIRFRSLLETTMGIPKRGWVLGLGAGFGEVLVPAMPSLFTLNWFLDLVAAIAKPT